LIGIPYLGYNDFSIILFQQHMEKQAPARNDYRLHFTELLLRFKNDGYKMNPVNFVSKIQNPQGDNMEKIHADRMIPIRDVIYQNIRKAILRGIYLPGERLMEEQLARELGTSRTPVREALRKLEVEKIVSHHPYRGVVVSEIKKEEIEDLYEIRTLVETIIVKHAAQNATTEDIARLTDLMDKEESTSDVNVILDCIDEYNRTIAEIANCPYIADFARMTRETLGRMIISTHLQPKRRPRAQKEHREIVAALAAGDGKLAQKLTVQHLKNASRSVRSGPSEQIA
jgi:DNA-binding GntR family transcriptional regulator